MARIQDLSQKLAYVVGRSEFRHIRQMLRPSSDMPVARFITMKLRDQSLAEVVGVGAAQWSRMKKGEDPIQLQHLSFLSTHLDLDGLDPECWREPLETFKQLLLAQNYGKLRFLKLGDRLGEILRSLADPSARGLRIIAAVRGIGRRPGQYNPVVLLTEGDEVQIEVDMTPGFPHLIVLSEEPSGALISLVPYSGRRDTFVAGDRALLPDQSATYPVGRPFGRHSLFAILTAEPVGLDAALDFSSSYPSLSDAGESLMRQTLAAPKLDSALVLSLAYEVHP